MGAKRRPWGAAATLVLVIGAVGGCTGGAARPPGRAPSAAPAVSVPPVSLTVTPANGARDVPVSVEVGTTVTGGTVTSVTLREAGGGPVAGDFRADRSTWVPVEPLKNEASYEATVTAADAAGRQTTTTTAFTTMRPAEKRTGTGLYLFDGTTYGVAMPVVAEFDPGIREQDRAEVQRRLFVRTDPAQPGTWSWVANGTQAYYRAPEYWKPGTTLTVRLGVGGHPTGDGRYGDRDRAATATIGRDLRMSVDNGTKQMTVTENGQHVRTMPVSLGKPSTPSSSGTLVVMEKKEHTVFDTTDAPVASDRYRTDIDYAQRLTWGGEYIHSAPWSEGSQGRRNVSHGCVNLSAANARWLFDRTLVGDPVEVKGTERELTPGNGWTAWDLGWEEFVKGSALPVTTGTASPSASPSPAPA